MIAGVWHAACDCPEQQAAAATVQKFKADAEALSDDTEIQKLALQCLETAVVRFSENANASVVLAGIGGDLLLKWRTRRTAAGDNQHNSPLAGELIDLLLTCCDTLLTCGHQPAAGRVVMVLLQAYVATANTREQRVTIEIMTRILLLQQKRNCLEGDWIVVAQIAVKALTAVRKHGGKGAAWLSNLDYQKMQHVHRLVTVTLWPLAADNEEFRCALLELAVYTDLSNRVAIWLFDNVLSYSSKGATDSCFQMATDMLCRLLWNSDVILAISTGNFFPRLLEWLAGGFGSKALIDAVTRALREPRIEDRSMEHILACGCAGNVFGRHFCTAGIEEDGAVNSMTSSAVEQKIKMMIGEEALVSLTAVWFRIADTEDRIQCVFRDLTSFANDVGRCENFLNRCLELANLSTDSNYRVARLLSLAVLSVDQQFLRSWCKEKEFRRIVMRRWIRSGSSEITSWALDLLAAVIGRLPVSDSLLWLLAEDSELAHLELQLWTLSRQQPRLASKVAPLALAICSVLRSDEHQEHRAPFSSLVRDLLATSTSGSGWKETSPRAATAWDALLAVAIERPCGDPELQLCLLAARTNAFDGSKEQLKDLCEEWNGMFKKKGEVIAKSLSKLINMIYGGEMEWCNILPLLKLIYKAMQEGKNASQIVSSCLGTWLRLYCQAPPDVLVPASSEDELDMNLGKLFIVLIWQHFTEIAEDANHRTDEASWDFPTKLMLYFEASQMREELHYTVKELLFQSWKFRVKPTDNQPGVSSKEFPAVGHVQFHYNRKVGVTPEADALCASILGHTKGTSNGEAANDSPDAATALGEALALQIRNSGVLRRLDAAALVAENTLQTFLPFLFRELLDICCPELWQMVLDSLRCGVSMWGAALVACDSASAACLAALISRALLHGERQWQQVALCGLQLLAEACGLHAAAFTMRLAENVGVAVRPVSMQLLPLCEVHWSPHDAWLVFQTLLICHRFDHLRAHAGYCLGVLLVSYDAPLLNFALCDGTAIGDAPAAWKSLSEAKEQKWIAAPERPGDIEGILCGWMREIAVEGVPALVENAPLITGAIRLLMKYCRLSGASPQSYTIAEMLSAAYEGLSSKSALQSTAICAVANAVGALVEQLQPKGMSYGSTKASTEGPLEESPPTAMPEPLEMPPLSSEEEAPLDTIREISAAEFLAARAKDRGVGDEGEEAVDSPPSAVDLLAELKDLEHQNAQVELQLLQVAREMTNYQQRQS